MSAKQELNLSMKQDIWHFSNAALVKPTNAKNARGVLPEKNGWGCATRSLKPSAYPISDQNLRYSLPFLRPEALEPGA